MGEYEWHVKGNGLLTKKLTHKYFELQGAFHDRKLLVLNLF
jgi:hypothetical protein